MHDSIPATRHALIEAFSQEEVFNLERYLDSQEMRIVSVTRDLVDYCRGEVEGSDLQLSDSRDLPLAQAIAEEELALERGADEEGLPFTPEDARFHRLPQPSLPLENLDRILDQWLSQRNLRLPCDPRAS
jgi:hypothetical protein